MHWQSSGEALPMWLDLKTPLTSSCESHGDSRYYCGDFPLPTFLIEGNATFHSGEDENVFLPIRVRRIWIPPTDPLEVQEHRWGANVLQHWLLPLSSHPISPSLLPTIRCPHQPLALQTHSAYLVHLPICFGFSLWDALPLDLCMVSSLCHYLSSKITSSEGCPDQHHLKWPPPHPPPTTLLSSWWLLLSEMTVSIHVLVLILCFPP